MANEISVTSNLTASKGGIAINPGSKTKLITMTGGDMVSGTFQCHVTPATSKQVTWGSIATDIPGYVRIVNNDAAAIVTTNGVTGFTETFGFTLLPGQFALFPPTTTALWVRSTVTLSLLEISAVDI